MAKTGLSETDICAILSVIDGWSEPKISWLKLVQAIDDRLGWQYTRQALNKYHVIKNAFQIRQRTLRGTRGKSYVRSVELQKALERSNYQEAKIKRLESENMLLKEQLVRWLKNATDADITIERLDRPLAMPYREASRKRHKRKPRK